MPSISRDCARAWGMNSKPKKQNSEPPLLCYQWNLGGVRQSTNKICKFPLWSRQGVMSTGPQGTTSLRMLALCAMSASLLRGSEVWSRSEWVNQVKKKRCRVSWRAYQADRTTHVWAGGGGTCEAPAESHVADSPIWMALSKRLEQCDTWGWPDNTGP